MLFRHKPINIPSTNFIFISISIISIKVKHQNIIICVVFRHATQTRITSNTNAGISAHLGCRVDWSAARSDIPPDLLSAHEVGGVVVAGLPLLVGQVEDRWAKERGLLTGLRPRRRRMLEARLAWAPLL